MTVLELAQKLGGRMFLVGGAVRDQLLGKAPKDHDFVLTGVRLEDVDLPKIAGKDFPVFLVEVDGQVVEVAMARTEKKVAQGYHGFEFHTDPSITIEQDLRRRDLTINAMAIDVVTGGLIDPFGGQKDLQNRTLRHTSEAFAEDPLRVYRVARFAAQLGFRVAPETRDLMLQLKPELVTLTPERVFQEFQKALVTRFPDLFFRTLEGLLDVHFSEIEGLKVPDQHDGTTFEHTMAAIFRGNGFRERFALLCHDLGKGLSPNPPVHHGHDKHEHLIQSLGDRLRMPKRHIMFARKSMRLHMKLKNLHEMRLGKLVRLVEPELFLHLRVSFLESGGRYDRHLFLKHIELIKKVLKVKKLVTGQVLLDRGINPDPLFGEKLLQERVRVLRRDFAQL